MTPVFFGCLGRPGHYEHVRQGDGLAHSWGALPTGLTVADGIDGGFAPRPSRNEEAPQGQASVTVRDGWTCLAFWDRSGDRRPGSNSAFVLPGELDFATALDSAREAFPMVFKRFSFEVQEYRP